MDVQPIAAPSEPVADDPRRTLRRGVALIAQAIRTHPRPFTVALAGGTLFALMSVASTVVLGRVTDRLILPAFRTGVDRGVVFGSMAAIMIVAFLRAIGVVGRRFFGGMTSFRMKATWRSRLVDVYLAAPLSFHRGHSTGELMAHADTDTEAATEALNPVPFSISAVVIGVVAAIRLLWVDPVLALVGITLFPALALINRVYTARVEAPAGRVQARFGDMASVAHESFDGALAVKTLGLAERETGRLSDAAAALRTERLHVGRLRAGFEPALDLLPNLGIIVLLALGVTRLEAGAVTVGELVEGMALFGVLTLPMRVMGYLLEELPRAVVAADRLEEVLASPPAPLPDEAAVEAPTPGALPVVVRDLTYGFGTTPILRGVDVEVPAGQVVALVGATGTGKSTLFDLLTHLAEPWSGSVELGGVPVSGLDPTVLRDRVALVFQETFLFGDTLRENLSLGADLDDEAIDRAARIAHADRFLSHLPDGLDTVLGERGVTLSGGQRQRVALTRALVRRPDLLLLDDATSAVDPRIEREILLGLRRELRATTIVVAHRVSTIMMADRVLYLDGGRITADGTHDELLATVPGYQALVRAYETEVDEDLVDPDDEADDESGDELAGQGAAR
jgi:ABC-type multidrug transport system fused ATPase/permease subunit